MIFVRERRCKVSQAKPNMPVLQIMKEVGNEWQGLNPTERKYFQDMADIDKVRYKEELKEFEKEVEKLHVEKPCKTKSNQKQKQTKKIVEHKIENVVEAKDIYKQKSKVPLSMLETQENTKMSPVKEKVQRSIADDAENFRDEF